MQPTPTNRAARTRGATTPTALMKRARFWLICLFFLFWAVAIAGAPLLAPDRPPPEYVERAQKQQQRTFEVAPRRGILYDRNMRELAMTVQVDSIYAVPYEIDDKQAAARARSPPIVHTDPEDALDHRAPDRRAPRRRPQLCLDRAPRHARSCRRRQSPQHEGHLLPERIPALLSRQPDRRAGAGLRRPRRQRPRRPRSRNSTPRCTAHPAACTPPSTRAATCSAPSSTNPSRARISQLTIDENIQFMAERALDHAMEKTHADNGTVVVQDVHTGQILALAIRPTFNPNQFRHTTPELLQEPRRQRRLRARLDLQARHLLRGDRSRRRQARRHDRLPGRPDHARRPRHS